MKLRSIATALTIAVLLLASGCPGTSPESTIPPEVTNELKENLGYALAPYYLPEGFEFHTHEVSGPLELTATVVYRKLDHHIFVMYPTPLPPPWGKQSPLWERLGLDWQRPADAVSIVEVNGEEAYSIRGWWSADTLRLLEKLDLEQLQSHTPEWDYDFSLSLHLEYELPEGNRVPVMLRAPIFPAEWITDKEMVKIAESLGQVD